MFKDGGFIHLPSDGHLPLSLFINIFSSMFEHLLSILFVASFNIQVFSRPWFGLHFEMAKCFLVHNLDFS